MKRRGGKCDFEGDGWKKSPVLTKIMREIIPNQNIGEQITIILYLEKRIFSTWQKVLAEGIFVNDLNFVSRQLGLETSFGTQSIISLTRSTSSRTLFSTG